MSNVAFEVPVRDYTVTATYMADHKAKIKVMKGEDLIKSFVVPAYKIWNFLAHAHDIVDGLEQNSDDGLRIAGSDGLGGNVYPG